MMAGEEGFEPSYAGIKIRCLNQLGDSPVEPCLFCGSLQVRDCVQSWSGCLSNPRVTKPWTCEGSVRSSARASVSVLNSANTHAPEPVMRACGQRSLSHASCAATAG